MRERRTARKSPTLAGQLLLAHPVLRDPNFRRTVVLLSGHDAEGAMGVVLNRPLGKQLGDLQKGLENLGIKPGKGFGQAQREMEGAAGALGKGQGEQAVGSQGRALQALREGAQDMMNQMQAQGQGQGPGQGVPQYGQNGRDPLGRRQQNAGPDFGDQVKVPDEIDTQRARQILEEIRRKLGDSLSPELERQYLERLLDMR